MTSKTVAALLVPLLLAPVPAVHADPSDLDAKFLQALDIGNVPYRNGQNAIVNRARGLRRLPLRLQLFVCDRRGWPGQPRLDRLSGRLVRRRCCPRVLPRAVRQQDSHIAAAIRRLRCEQYQPFWPLSPSRRRVVARADDTDDRFVKALQQEGIGMRVTRDQLIHLGHTICHDLDNGKSAIDEMHGLYSAADTASTTPGRWSGHRSARTARNTQTR